MPFETEKDGAKIIAYTKAEVDEAVQKAVVEETVSLKMNNKLLKEEKTALAEKERVAAEAASQAEVDKAVAEKDSVKIAELLEKQKEDLQAQIKSRDESTKREKVSSFLHESVNAIGLGGELNNDLETLLKARVKFDYNIESGEVIASDSVTGLPIADLKKHVTESGKYDRYLSAGGASGAGANGGQAAGAVENPFKEGKHFNLTKQAELLRTNKPLYDRLKSQA